MKPFVSLVIPDGTSGGEEAFLRSILLQNWQSRGQIVGGSTGNDFTSTTSYQFANGVYNHAGVMALITSALKMGTGMVTPITQLNMVWLSLKVKAAWCMNSIIVRLLRP